MAGKIEFSTQELEIVEVNNFYFHEVSDTDTCFAEDVLFQGDCFGIPTIFRNTKTLRLSSLNNVITNLDKGITLYYDHNYWPGPFDKLGFEPDTNGPYKAVISLHAVTRGDDGKLRSGTDYGTFWYDQEGILKAVDGGSITGSKWETRDSASLKFRRMPDGNWQVFKINELRDPFLYFLEGKVLEAEDIVVENGQEIEFDEMIYSLSDDDRFRLHQRTITGHKQKTIEVPSRVDIPRWSTILNTLNGEWVKATKEFPTTIDLMA